MRGNSIPLLSYLSGISRQCERIFEIRLELFSKM